MHELSRSNRLRSSNLSLLLVALLFVVAVPRRADAAMWEEFFAGEGIRPLSRDYRIALATSLNEVFDPLRRTIPPLTDEDRKWLQQHASRLADFSEDSPEHLDALIAYAKSIPRLKTTAIDGLSAISDASRCIVDQAHSELSCWARLSAALLDEQAFNAIFRLRESGTITIDEPRSRRLVADPYASQIPRGLGQRILSDILLPNLSARGL